MPFSVEDKKELYELIQTAMDEQSERRRKKYLEDKANQEPEPKTTKTFLVTVGGRVAFPDDRGHSLFTDCFYANVGVNQSGKPEWFLDHSVEVVAYGDGRLFERPFIATLAGLVSMVEVQPGFLESVSVR